MTRLLRLLGALFALSLVLTACGDDDGGDGEDTESADDGGCDGDVCLSGTAFDPADLSVAAGESVKWTNIDGTDHTVTADDDSFDSGTLSDGDSFDFTFEDSGEIAYHCEIHPSMTGTLTVE